MKTKKLSEISDIQYGYAFDSHYFTNDNKYPQLVRIRDIKRGFSETYYLGKYDEDYVVHYGDLLIGMDGNFNISRWKSEDALLNQRVCKIAAKQDIIDEEYLQYALSRRLKHIEEKTAFVTVKHLSAKTLSNLKLEVPSQVEQIKIAQIISKISKAINTKKDELRKLDELIKARFVELFGDLTTNNRGWKTENFSCVFENITSSKRILKSEWKSNGIPFLRVRDLVQLSEKEVLNNEFFISSELYSRLSDNDGVPKNGDILVSATSTLGKCHIVNSNEKLYFKDADVLRFRPSNKINAVYFTECMNDHFIQGQIEHNLGVTTVKHFTIKAAKSILIRIPPLSLQNEFANFVQQVDKSGFD